MKVFRTMQFTSYKINYELLIRDVSLLHKLGMFRDEYLMGKKYKNHDLFDVPDNESSILELCVVSNFALQHQINVAMGIIGFDSNCDEMNDALKVVIEHFYKNCRSDDFLGYVDKNKVLFILINCDAHNTPQVIDRIHSAINKQLLKRRLPSISVIYGNVAQKLAAKPSV